MQLTEVKVYPVTDDEKLKGYATIVITSYSIHYTKLYDTFSPTTTL